MTQRDPPPSRSPTIPARVVIGVTGHRTIGNREALTEQVHAVLSTVAARLAQPGTPVQFTVLSPLAEGADRLVAMAVLEQEESQIEAVLPLAKDDYLTDFADSTSKAEFERLLTAARQVRTLPPAETRPQAYSAVGRWVVDHCDLLIALWDGRPAAGEGGTAEIVEYARDRRCPTFWIHSDTGELRSTPDFDELQLERFRLLARYNAEPIDEGTVGTEIERETRGFTETAEAAGLDGALARRIAERVFPHYVKADQLALRYQSLYMRAGILLYACAAAAVAVVTFQSLFVPDYPSIVLFEVVLMAVVLGGWRIGTRRRWHSKWMDYRFLAERLRSAPFIALAGLDATSVRPPRQIIPGHDTKQWMAAAFAAAWRQLPLARITSDSDLTPLRQFLVAQWIEPQVRHHRNRAERHHLRHRRLEWTGGMLFGLTFAAAVLHSLDIGPHALHGPLAFMAIVFPAIGAAAGAISTHREYVRNERRSHQMVRYLEDLSTKLQAAGTLDELLALVREAEELMRYENEDWRVLVQFKPIPLPK